MQSDNGPRIFTIGCSCAITNESDLVGTRGVAINDIVWIATCCGGGRESKMECLDDKEPSDRYAASLTEDGRYRLLVEAVTDYGYLHARC